MRRATSADVVAIRKLTRDVYAKWIPAIGREPFPMSADYDIAVRDHWIDLHEVDNEIIALIEMIPRPDYLYIENIAVALHAQGRGLARLLLTHANEIARKSDLPELRLATNIKFETNLGLYEHLGFTAYETAPLPDGGKMVRFKRLVP